mmetsp:Transcript_10605/g.25107  ORF Transcript_10605/g.25107 Transcript_10605/m.25107 type:complete len:296 (+) Transcript_10605:158-1045(+)
MNRQVFSVAAKLLGRRQLATQSTRSVAALSSLSSSSALSSSDTNTDNLARSFSSMSLRRPPSKHKQERGNGERKQKWRSHAVSLDYGDYRDDFDDDDDYYGNSNMTVADSDASDYASSNSGSSPSWHEEESELAGQVQEIQRQEDERRKRWLENAKPPVRRPIIDERGRAYGRGGRKTASARVWIQPGFGNVVINKKDFVDYFDRTTDRELILEPLAATETLGRFDITATVEGGGLRGQAGAIRHGLARALNHYNPDTYRPPLKRLGYLTRDPRKVERKKVGHLKARKKPQWVKR